METEVNSIPPPGAPPFSEQHEAQTAGIPPHPPKGEGVGDTTGTGDTDDTDEPTTQRVWLQAHISEELLVRYVHLNSEYVGDMSRREAVAELRDILQECLAEKLRVVEEYTAKVTAAKPPLRERPRAARVAGLATSKARSPLPPVPSGPVPTVTADLLAKLRTNAPADLRVPTVPVTAQPPDGEKYDGALNNRAGEVLDV